jgi:hypothetical protein
VAAIVGTVADRGASAEDAGWTVREVLVLLATLLVAMASALVLVMSTTSAV